MTSSPNSTRIKRTSTFLPFFSLRRSWIRRWKCCCGCPCGRRGCSTWGAPRWCECFIYCRLHPQYPPYTALVMTVMSLRLRKHNRNTSKIAQNSAKTYFVLYLVILPVLKHLHQVTLFRTINRTTDATNAFCSDEDLERARMSKAMRCFILSARHVKKKNESVCRAAFWTGISSY